MEKVSTEQLIAARALLHWHQLDVAKRMGISQSTVCEHERGLQIRPKRMTKLRDIFESEGIRFVDSDEEHGVVLRHNNGA